jgi:2-amino-4-hydroxy-6-hydroxymethyldihydropteridine diphosphokinase
VRDRPVRVCVGLGANLGDARAALDAALLALAKLPGTQLLRASSVYRTAPIDASGDDYLNAVAELHTTLPPHDLLFALQGIEADHGRERPDRNAPRTLDLDLLLYGDERIATPTLVVPHPRLHERAFVLVPLAELSPDCVVPGRGAVKGLLAGVADQRVDKLTA